VRFLRLLLLAFLLLGGQQLLLLHATDHLDAAHPDHACELCLHAGALENGIAPSAISFAAPTLGEAPLLASRDLSCALFARPFDARGPPVQFSA
jgi:hypothetical protein